MTITQRSKKFKFERNRNIATKFFSRNKKYTARSLANEYQLSETRVYQILRDWKKFGKNIDISQESTLDEK